MAQNRPPPAYQEWAASTLANMTFRLASPAAKGLWYVLKLECWLNHGVPSDVQKLAKYIGWEAALVADALPEVMPDFLLDGDRITHPGLEDYRADLARRHGKQSEGGKKSAAVKKRDDKSPVTLAVQGGDDGSSTLQAPCDKKASTLQVLKPIQTKPNQVKTSQPGKDLPPTDKGEIPAYTEWMNEGSDKPAGNDYERASNGY